MRSSPHRWRGTTGAAVVEFGVVLPVLMTFLFGAMRFGIAVNNYVVLTQAVRQGARTFAATRGSATGRTKALDKVSVTAPNLPGVRSNTHTYVNGSECASDAACSTALSTAYNTNQYTAEAKVLATYSCSVRVMSITFPCTLTSTMAARVE
jgi:Flp pilus assembly protein TadG